MPKPSRFQDIDLVPAALHLLENALAPATRKSYDSACSSYETHSHRYRYIVYPASVKSITHWLASLTTTVKPEMANGYLKALRSTHIEKASLRISSMTRSSRCVSTAQNESMARATRDSSSPLQPQSSSRSSLRPKTTSMAPTSRQRCAWRLPDSFDLVNLRGIHPTLPSYVDTSSSTIISAPSPSPSRRQKPTPSDVASPSSSLPRHPHFVLSPHSAVFIPGSHSTKPNPYSLAPSAPSIGNTSSTKVKELLLRAGIATTGFSGHSLHKGAAVSA